MQRVTAAIIQHQGKIMIAKRKPGKHMGPRWEFPGGKVNPGETPEQCLRRELAEEFSVQAEIGDFIGSVRFRNNEVELEVLAYRVVSTGTFKLNEHEELAWVRPDQLSDYDLVDSDQLLAARLLAEPAA